MLLLIISLILDLFLNQYIPYQPFDLTYFQPMFLVTSLFIYSYFFGMKKNSIFRVVIMAILYDLLFGSIYLIQIALFLLVFYMVKFVIRRVSKNFFTFILMLVMSLTIYMVVQHLLLIIIGYKGITISMLYYQITHSLLINVIYGGILYYLLGIKLKFK